MPHEVQSGEPTELTAGQSWAWDKTLSDHPPSDGWTLKYALRGPEDADFTAAANGDTYEIREGPAETDLDAGRYRLVGYIEKGDPVTDRHVIYEGTLRVRANPITAVNTQTHAEKTLAVIEAALEGRLTADEEEFEINGRSVRRIPVEELYRLRNRYRTEVAMERSPGRMGPSVEVRFGAPS